MPMYEFTCTSCHKPFERFLSMANCAEPQKCECGAAAQRVFSVPRAKTDSFRNDTPCGNAQFQGDPLDEEVYIGTAKKAGFSTNGKVYLHGLAEYPGDLKAWVRDKGEAKKILQEKGWGCESLGVKPVITGEPVEQVGVAEELVERELERMVEHKEIDPHDKEKKRFDVADRLTMSHLRGKYKPPEAKSKKPKKKSRR